MKKLNLLKANFSRHKSSMTDIFVIMIIVSLTLMSVLTLWFNTHSYLREELDRMNYGDFTAWTEDVKDQNQLMQEINALQDVESVLMQPLIYSNYEINGQESDSEGQLLVYDSQDFPYKILNENHSGYQEIPVTILPSEIYISASLLSTFSAEIGDEMSFAIGRQGNPMTFTIKGTYEDPFMGSSMIGMKSFLISQQDYDAIRTMMNHLGVDRLAKSGEMFHIQQSSQSSLNNIEFSQLLNEQTDLGNYLLFAHSKEAIIGFMLILQKAFTGLFFIFSIVQLLVSLIVVGYGLNASMEQDFKNIGILKTIGYSGKQLRNNLKLQYLFVILSGVLVGILLSFISIPILSSSIITFSGILTPVTIDYKIGVSQLIIVFGLFYGFIHFKTRHIISISPLSMIQAETGQSNQSFRNPVHLQKQGLLVRIALRQLKTEIKLYLSICITAILLVCFISMISRMNTWLGPDGKGMMDAFNPADHDIGVQLLGQHQEEELEAFIHQYSAITDQYKLAMVNVTMNDVDYTANVITEPERFHIQQGTTSNTAYDVVITETIAVDRNLSIDDHVFLSYNGKRVDFRVSGIYQCANDMGANLGMSRDGFVRMGEETDNMWCKHYFLANLNQKQKMIDALNEAYGGDIYIHENTWPGLISIISAMKGLLVVMYSLTIVFVLIVTVLSSEKVFHKERMQLSIYKALGFTSRQLRLTYTVRYGFMACLGSIIGSLLSFIFTDTFVSSLLKLYGISNFASKPGMMSLILPGFIVSLLFSGFAYPTSRPIKKLDFNELTNE